MDAWLAPTRALGGAFVVLVFGYGLVTGQLLLAALVAMLFVFLVLLFRLTRAVEDVASALEDGTARDGDRSRLESSDPADGEPRWDRLDGADDDRAVERNRTD